MERNELPSRGRHFASFDFTLLIVLMLLHMNVMLFEDEQLLLPELPLFVLLFVAGYLTNNKLLQQKVIVILFLLFAVSGLSIVFAGLAFVVDPIEQLLSVVNLIFSIVCSLGLISFLYHKKQQLYFTSCVFFVGITLYAALELFVLPFEDLSDYIRSILYFENRLYDADYRDYRDFLFERPKAFGVEPSYLGISITSIGVVVFALASTFKARVATVAFLFVATIIVRSPTAIPLMGLLPYIYFFKDERVSKRARVYLGVLLPGLCLLAFIVLAQLFEERAGQFVSGNDNSGDIRLIKPILAAYLSITHSPVSGTGIGGRELLAELMWKYGDWSKHIGALKNFGNSWATAVFLIWTEMGLLAIVVLSLLNSLFKHYLTFINKYDFLVVFMLVGLTMGGWTHPRLWFFVVLLLFAINETARGFTQTNSVLLNK